MIRLIPCFLLLLFHLNSYAQSSIRGPLSSSMGGTGIAGLADIEGVFLNPAEVAILPGHMIGAYYHDGYVDDGQHRQAIGLGAGDPGPNVMFPGGLHYFRTRDTGRSVVPADGELWHLAIGDRWGEQVAVGLSGYRLSYKMRGFAESVQWNGSVGVIWMLNQKFGLGYVINNVKKPDETVPLGLQEELRQGVGMFAEVMSIANVRFDITRDESHNPDKKFAFMASFESMSGKFFVFRTGYRLDDQRNQRFATVGMGFNGPRLKLDYSFEKNMEGTSGALHSVDLRVPF